MPDQIAKMTVEEADALLAKMMPNESQEVRLSVVTLAVELVNNPKAPNGMIYTIGPGKDDGRHISVEVRYGNGKSAAETIVELRAERDRLMRLVEELSSNLSE